MTKGIQCIFSSMQIQYIFHSWDIVRNISWPIQLKTDMENCTKYQKKNSGCMLSICIFAELHPKNVKKQRQTSLNQCDYNVTTITGQVMIQPLLLGLKVFIYRLYTDYLFRFLYHRATKCIYHTWCDVLWWTMHIQGMHTMWKRESKWLCT